MQEKQATQQASPTRTAAILDALRDDIVDGSFTPGERLRFDALRDQYNVGISPLREALMHLASQGLVVPEQRKGYHVAPVSRADLIEVARLRSEFDALALQESIANGDELWEGRIVAAFHTLTKKSKLGPDEEVDPTWEEYHIRFHEQLVSECRLPKLLTFRSILELQARRYRRISAHYLTSPRDDLREHRDIQDATLSRNSALASKLIKDHYMQTVEIILSNGSDLLIG